MSDEYIKREDAITEIAEFLMGEALLDSADASDEIEDWKEIAVAILENIPSADVVERKRGEWMWDGRWFCSECKEEAISTKFTVLTDNPLYFKSRFCHYCGADMRGDDNESD